MTIKVHEYRTITIGLIFVTLLLVTSALVFFTHEDDKDTDEMVSSASNRSGESNIHVTDEDIGELKAEIERLKGNENHFEKKLASLGTQFSALNLHQQSLDKSDGRKDSDMALSPDTALANPLTAEEQLERQEIKIQKKLELLEATVLNEEPDHEWAESVRNTFHDAIQRDGMKGLNLVEADCRTTMCRIDLTMDTTLEESGDNMAFLDLWEGPGFITLNETDGQVVLYIAREGFSLPRT